MCVCVFLYGPCVSTSDLVFASEVLLGNPGKVKLDERHRAKDFLGPFAIWNVEVMALGRRPLLVTEPD